MEYQSKWELKITNACKEAGTYREYFYDVIKTLASILEKRDLAEEEFKECGGQIMMAYTNKSGATNLIINPLVKEWESLNSLALTYWRDLGLTPAGLKKIDEASMKPKKKNAFAEVVKDLAG